MGFNLINTCLRLFPLNVSLISNVPGFIIFKHAQIPASNQKGNIEDWFAGV